MKRIILFFFFFCSSAAIAQSDSRTTAHMAIPNVKGVLEVDVGTTNFQIRVRPDGKEVQLRALERADGLEISAFLQRVEFAASAEKCREEWWTATKKASPFKRENLQQSTKDGIARVEYTITEYKGVQVRQKSLHAYVGSGDLCAEVHLSKVQFKPENQQLFEQVLSSLKLLSDESYSGNSGPNQISQPDDVQHYVAEGSKFYLQHDYSAAANFYQKALDLEKQRRTLSKDYFRVLIDNLGMSYGISGKLEQAKATFEFGITQDPEYPLFYYNMACTYGEIGKMQEALANLRLSYKYKANMIVGEFMPDPLKDDSFRSFVAKKEFVAAVTEMQK